MLRYGFVLILLLCSLIACQAPALPTLDVPRTATPAGVAVANPTVPALATVPAATTAPNATPTFSPTAAPSATTTSTQTPSRTATRTRTRTLSPTLSLTASPTTSRTASASRTATVSITETAEISPTRVVTATVTVTRTATRRPTARPTATPPPAGPAALTPYLEGQPVTSMFVSTDGTIYYGVAPSPELLQFPARAIFQLWKLPPGGTPFAITPDTMHMIGGILVRNGTIYFNELGTLRRMPDNGQVSEGQVLLRYPAYIGNRGLPYGHMNNSLAAYNLNGQDVLLMGMGSVRDSAFPGQGLPADVTPPYYEEFPTGRITYATFDWLDQQYEYSATRGVAGQYDEFARGIRNPWGMAVGQVNGQTHIYAVDNDPSFTPEKYDAVPNNAGDELNDIRQATDYGHPFSYGGGQPVVNFPDTSVPSGVAVAAGKIFVGMQVGNMVVKVDPVTHTYTPVLENISSFHLFAVGNMLYIATFNGILAIDATGL